MMGLVAEAEAVAVERVKVGLASCAGPKRRQSAVGMEGREVEFEAKVARVVVTVVRVVALEEQVAAAAATACMLRTQCTRTDHKSTRCTTPGI